VRTNPFYDSWLFIIGQTNDHINSGVGPLLVVVFFGLLIGSSWIAWHSWQEDPSQRTREIFATWFMRVIIGCMWFQGSLWKLPLPVSGGFKYWTEERSRYAAFGWHKALVEGVYLPLIQVIDPIVFSTELTFAVSYILGFMVRPVAVIGVLFTLHLWLGLYVHPGEWPWEYIFLVFVQGFFFVTNAGRSLGLDALLHRKPIGLFAGDSVIARLYFRLA